MSTSPRTDDESSAVSSVQADHHLAHRLQPRHLTMMGLGSAIGAGLFLGTGKVIPTAGPAVLISYAVAGVLVIMVMRMLAEMASEIPSTGSFSHYAEVALGRWAGFLLGWIYWYMLIMVLGAEITGVAEIITTWAPDLPPWSVALFFVVVFAAVNLLGVRQFGEAEFWFASIKVIAIIFFLVIGVLLVFGWLPDTDSVGTSNLLGHGGFAPNGISGIAAALLVVAFAFGGIEIVAIAAAEAKDPAAGVARATRSIVWRILLFYIGSIAIMVLVMPWNSPKLADGPFKAVFELAHLPAAALVMQIVVVIALLSAFNAQIYGTSRMAFFLSGQGDGPAALRHVSRRGVPDRAVMVSVFFALVIVGLIWWAPAELLGYLLNAVGASLLVVWVMIAVSQLRLRPRLQAAAEAEGRPMALRISGYPWVTWAVLVAYAALIVLMAFDAAARTNLLVTAGVVLVILAIYVVTARLQRGRGARPMAANRS